MIIIPLINVPNQSLSIQLDGTQYDIAIHATKDGSDGSPGIMAVDIVRSNVVIVSGARAVYGFPIIPYNYLFSTFGNFAFSTQNDDYPDWRQFGITQYLVYLSNAELNMVPNGRNQT